MKRLSDLYSGYPDILINDIKINSKEVEKGDIFVCVKGVTADRHDYIDEAIQNGAKALAIQENRYDISKIPQNITVIVSNDNRKLLDFDGNDTIDYRFKNKF